MRIGELARQTGFSQETIRHYERIGLIPAPARGESNYRTYGPEAASRLQFIANCRALDMTLSEIRRLLSLRDDPAARCGAASELVSDHLNHVRARIGELQQLAEQLEVIESQCQADADTTDCGILNELDRMGPVGRDDAESSHVPGSHGPIP
ncbi:Cd(II)/Pb(II)-responsive transcriptional regulator [Tamilnaduibacter salinus]|uniref:Cd(II)/Pb(II)-responsive transcriptional regulator n=1 Tax=Tamilnaduibacter salinus TaxID=1484056 RepID=A0A2U1CWX1_9GAMM|nr:Cd(II)/Pb(II)-responsive transcriptional regulator [Tamilnaduibacter salinus]PVY76488.1 Cd(II)/Pb(II)-responsive transcriptional regulator [Tamilnaduibacter salinus]